MVVITRQKKEGEFSACYSFPTSSPAPQSLSVFSSCGWLSGGRRLWEETAESGSGGRWSWDDVDGFGRGRVRT